MENKYFKPDWKDITLEGYEIELDTWNGWVRGTFPEVLEKNSELDEYSPDDLQKLAHGIYRVPFLTKEQIEAEGWIPELVLTETNEREDKFVDGYTKYLSEDHWYQLELISESEVQITEKHYRNEVAQVWKVRYSGPCPTINELRTLQRWFKIK
jgi:hypothetical protein